MTEKSIDKFSEPVHVNVIDSYPDNIINVILKDEKEKRPDDIEATFFYLLHTMPALFRDMIECWYRYRYPMDVMVKRFRMEEYMINEILKGCIKWFHHNSRYKFMKYGIKKLITKEVQSAIDKMMPDNSKEITINSSIDDLDLSVRSYCALKRAGVYTISDIVNLYNQQACTRDGNKLQKTVGIGRKSYNNIIGKMKILGFIEKENNNGQ